MLIEELSEVMNKWQNNDNEYKGYTGKINLGLKELKYRQTKTPQRINEIKR